MVFFGLNSVLKANLQISQLNFKMSQLYLDTIYLRQPETSTKRVEAIAYVIYWGGSKPVPKKREYD
jgi:hypothetical protein